MFEKAANDSSVLMIVEAATSILDTVVAASILAVTVAKTLRQVYQAWKLGLRTNLSGVLLRDGKLSLNRQASKAFSVR